MRSIGLLAGSDHAFAGAVTETLTRQGHAAGLVSPAAVRMAAPPEYGVILDLASHSVDAWRCVLKNAVLQGAHVVPDPFWQCAEDRFIATAMVARAGVPVPATCVLPNREHVEGVVPESLRNRAEPAAWTEMAARLGFPLILRPTRPGAGTAAAVWDMAGLLSVWEGSHLTQLMAQSFIHPCSYLRVVVVEQEVLVLDWDPTILRGVPARGPAADAAAEIGRATSDAVGHAVNVVDLAERDGAAFVVDPARPVSVFHPLELGAGFDWTVAKVADYLSRLASTPRANRYRWDGLRASLTPP